MIARGTGRSHVGLRRERNEDFLVLDNDVQLYLVCDGVGGRAGGDFASKVAAVTFAGFIRNRQNTLHQYSSTGKPNYLAALKIMHEAATAANNRVHELGQQLESCNGMRTTLTALLIIADKAVMVHVGDSRLYLLRDGGLQQLSQDHTVAARMVREAVMTKEEADESHLSNILTRVVGRPKVEVDSLLIDMRPGDRFLLCSDGLTHYCVGHQLKCLLVGELSTIPERLIRKANAQGGHDNTTVIVIDIEPRESSLRSVV